MGIAEKDYKVRDQRSRLWRNRMHFAAEICKLSIRCEVEDVLFKSHSHHHMRWHKNRQCISRWELSIALK